MAVLRIINARLLTHPSAPIIDDATLEAIDGIITFVGPSTSSPPCPAETEVLDAEHRLLMPGLVNAHTHAAMTLFRGIADDMPLKPWLEERIWPMEGRLEPEDVYWGTLLGIVEMLRAGVTCYNDMYHYFTAGARAAVDGGIRAVPAGVLLGFLPDAEARLAEAVEFCLDLRCTGPSRVTPMLGPHAPYTCPDPLLKQVIAAAQEHDLGIHIHLSETAGEVQDSLREHGVTPLRHMADLGMFKVQVAAAHCVHLTLDDIALAAESGVGCCHCPTSNMKLASGFAPVPELLRMGAIVGLGTDGAASNNNLDLLEEARLAALIHKGYSGDPTVINARQALEMATLGSARALGLEDQIGSLEVGKRADCLLIDLDHPHSQPLSEVVSQLVYAAQASDVHTVIVDGVILLRDRRFLALDEEQVIAEAVSRSARLAYPCAALSSEACP